MQTLRHDARAAVAAASLAFALPTTLALATAHAAERSRAARSEFQRHHPCPANGATRGACPGYVRDHIVPLCAGGSDTPGNMQWQTIADAKAKDRAEQALCRHLRRGV